VVLHHVRLPDEARCLWVNSGTLDYASALATLSKTTSSESISDGSIN
jgi:hypothetical protein